MALSATTRLSVPNDWQQIKAVHDAAFRGCHAPLLGQNAAAWFEPCGACFVSELDGNVVGFVFVAVDEDEGWVVPGHAVIEDIFVLPAHQGRGIGKALMAAAESHLLATGVSDCCLACLELCIGNHSFYESLGWSVRASRAFTCEEDGSRYRVYAKKGLCAAGAAPENYEYWCWDVQSTGMKISKRTTGALNVNASS
jgi:GNAT superfamily N-acetyltransferase